MIEIGLAASIAKKIGAQAKGASFLTEVYLESEDLQIIRSNTDEILTSSLEGGSPDVKIVASYLLMDIAMRRYDSAFWPHVSEEAGRDYTPADQSNLYDVFRNGLELIGMEKSLAIETKRKLEMILIHTLVPDNKEYMYAFFEFVSKYYKKVLGYELSEDLDSRFKELAEFISPYARSEQRDRVAELEEDFPNPASLNKCTQYALTEPALFGALLEKILRIIDAGYKGKMVPSLGIRRFAVPFQQWYSENIGSRSNKAAREEMRARHPRLVLRESSDYSVALVFPEMNQCTEDARAEFVFGTEVLTPAKQPQVLMIPGLRFPRTRQEVVYLFDKDLGRSVFERFVFKFDGKTLFDNDPKKRWKFFNKYLNEVQNPSPGETYVLLEDEKYDPRTDGNENMEKIRKGLYRALLKNGEGINLKGERYVVTDEDEDDLIGFNVQCYEGVSAEINSVRYKVAKDLQVVYRASDSEVISLPVMRIRVDSKPTVHIPVRFSKVRNTQVFSVPQNQIPEGVHIVKAELYSGERKVGEDEFITMPGLEYKFDAGNEVYYNESTGKLSIKHPIDKTIELATGDDEVSWKMKFEDYEISVYHEVPSVKFSVDGENWILPGANEISIDGFIDDAIRVKCPHPVRIYADNKPLDYIDREGYRSFFALEYKRRINDDLGKEHCIQFSIKSRSKLPLFRLLTHNDYVFMEGGLSVEMKRNTNNKAACMIFVEGEERQVLLNEGYNRLFDSLPSNAYMEIIEKREGKECLIMKKFVGDPVYMNVTRDGCTVYHYKESIEFSCGPGEYKEAEKEYSIKKAFNPWMKESEVEKSILNLFKLGSQP
jgi:hypothetical protein